MASAEALQRLRLLIGEVGVGEKEVWAAPRLSCGIAKGIVVELLGNARTEWLIEFFLQHPEPYIFWCERDPTINPTSLAQCGLDLDRIQFATVSGKQQKILHRALESGHYPFLVAPNKESDLKEIHRLHLLAGKSKSTVFLLADRAFSSAWPISLQLEVRFQEEEIVLEVHRQKYGRS